MRKVTAEKATPAEAAAAAAEDAPAAAAAAGAEGLSKTASEELPEGKM